MLLCDAQKEKPKADMSACFLVRMPDECLHEPWVHSRMGELFVIVYKSFLSMEVHVRLGFDDADYSRGSHETAQVSHKMLFGPSCPGGFQFGYCGTCSVLNLLYCIG